MATNDLLLQMAKESLDAVGNVLGEKVSEGISLVSTDSDEVESFKDSVKYSVGTLKDIPDEVYREIMTAYYDALDGDNAKIILKELTSKGKSFSEKVENIIDTLTRPVNSRTIELDDDTYKISFPLSKIGVDSVAMVTQGKNFSLLNWESEFFGKTALFKYFLSFWNIQQKLSDAVLSACFNVLKTNAPDLLQAAYSNAASSELKELLGEDISSSKSKVKAKIKDALPKNSYLNGALSKYGKLTKYYNKLQKEINSPKSTYKAIMKAKEKFHKAQDKLVSSLSKQNISVDLASLPEVLDPFDQYLKYNTAMTEASVLSGHAAKLENYYSKVKNIYANELTDAIEIVGNSKANKIYGGAGNDTIKGDAGNDLLYGGARDDILYGGTGKDSLLGDDGADVIFGEVGNDKISGDAGNDSIIGGKGNDSLWGGDGADIFYYEKGDGKDTIFDYAPDDDKIFLVSGSIDDIIARGSVATFQIGTGAIKIRDARDKEITFVLADNSESKYLNGKMISAG